MKRHLVPVTTVTHLWTLAHNMRGPAQQQYKQYTAELYILHQAPRRVSVPMLGCRCLTCLLRRRHHQCPCGGRSFHPRPQCTPFQRPAAGSCSYVWGWIDHATTHESKCALLMLLVIGFPWSRRRMVLLVWCRLYVGEMISKRCGSHNQKHGNYGHSFKIA